MAAFVTATGRKSGKGNLDAWEAMEAGQESSAGVDGQVQTSVSLASFASGWN